MFFRKGSWRGPSGGVHCFSSSSCFCQHSSDIFCNSGKPKAQPLCTCLAPVVHYTGERTWRQRWLSFALALEPLSRSFRSGFGGGVLVAQSALKSPPALARVNSEPDPSLRVVVPHASKPNLSATAPDEVLPPEPVQVAAKEPPKNAHARFQALRAEVQKKVEERAKREKRRYAERKARMIARARAIQQQQPTMAYAPAEQSAFASPSLFNASSSSALADGH